MRIACGAQVDKFFGAVECEFDGFVESVIDQLPAPDCEGGNLKEIRKRCSVALVTKIRP